MKVIIAGGRDYHDMNVAFLYLKHLLVDHPDPVTTIVSGGATGADSIGESWAMYKELSVIRFLPNWGDHGKAAGPIRNREMAEYADALVAFWDGKSKGTKNMIETALKNDCEVHVIRY